MIIHSRLVLRSRCVAHARLIGCIIVIFVSMSASTLLVSLLAALACVGSCGNGEGEEMCDCRQCTGGPEDILVLIPGADILNRDNYVRHLSADVCVRVSPW